MFLITAGKIRVGDQLMMINGQILLGITASEAERIINGVANTAKVHYRCILLHLFFHLLLLFILWNNPVV